MAAHCKEHRLPTQECETCVQEIKERLYKAFITHKADYIAAWSRSQHGWQITSGAIAEEWGWLDYEGLEIDEQYSELRWRLTDKGRQELESLAETVTPDE